MARPSRGIRKGVRLAAYYPPGDAAALDVLAAASGEGKASHMRRALSWYLAELALTASQETSVITRPNKKENER